MDSSASGKAVWWTLVNAVVWQPLYHFITAQYAYVCKLHYNFDYVN
jgi:hypothetical protein